MPRTEVLFYQEANGKAPVLSWLNGIEKQDIKAYVKCIESIERLGEFGFELRRPHADYLRDDIYELRVRQGNRNYRILYFFYGQNIVVLAHALSKEDRVPAADVERAILRKNRLERNPETHIYEED